MRIKVETRQDGDVHVPRRFSLNGDQVDVFEMVAQWIGADYRYCKVKGSDGALHPAARRTPVGMVPDDVCERTGAGRDSWMDLAGPRRHRQGFASVGIVARRREISRILAYRHRLRRRQRVIILILRDDWLQHLLRPEFRGADLLQAGCIPVRSGT